MANNDIDALLQRYLAGECSASEVAEIEAWLRVDPARQAYVASLRTLGQTWHHARPAFDLDEAWRKVAGHIVVEPVVQPASADQSAAERHLGSAGASRAAPFRRWLAAAAVIAAVAAGGIAIGMFSRSVSAPAMTARERVYTTGAGQQLSVRLDDGTIMRLAPESRAVVAANYGRAERTVELVGEANFEVVHDPARSFRVLAGGMVTWDLGTKFTVRAYRGERFYLAVEEGSVIIPKVLQAPLRSGDIAVVDTTGRGAVTHGGDLRRYTSWLDGVLEFQDTPLAEAVADLARWYGVGVTIADPELARRHITVVIDEPSIEKAIDLVAPAVGARYQRDGRGLTLHALDTP